MITRPCWALCLLILGSGLVWGEEQSIQLIRSENTGSELQLQVRQAPLKQVLDKIAGDTGLAIHYSVLPEGLVSATCVGTTIKQVMKCLLDRKADLIFRYPSTSSRDVQQIQPEEVWVLRTKFEPSPGTANSGVNKSVVSLQQIMQNTAGVQADAEHRGSDQTNALIEQARSKKPADRTDALSRLMTTGKAADNAVRKVLEEALLDKNANVRAQAISSLARSEGDGANAKLQEALSDSDVSVRLMAVGSMGSNAALLQQALTDSDPAVRELAEMKLDSLSNEVTQQQVMPKTTGAQTDTEYTQPDQIDALVERAKSNDPADRADAISQLLTVGNSGDATVRTVLEEALSDDYANVRAQAISSLARREGDSVTAELQVALNDSDASVRLMAVDSMGNNTALLQQALTDSDATVRELAAIRLESLSYTMSTK